MLRKRLKTLQLKKLILYIFTLLASLIQITGLLHLLTLILISLINEMAINHYEQNKNILSFTRSLN